MCSDRELLLLRARPDSAAAGDGAGRGRAAGLAPRRQPEGRPLSLVYSWLRLSDYATPDTLACACAVAWVALCDGRIPLQEAAASRPLLRTGRLHLVVPAAPGRPCR